MSTVVRVGLAVLLLVLVFAGGALTGYLYRGKDSAGEYQKYRAIVERYSEIAARVGQLEADLSDAQGELTGARQLIGQFRNQIAELTNQINGGADGVERAAGILDEIEKGIRGLQGGSPAVETP